LDKTPRWASHADSADRTEWAMQRPRLVESMAWRRYLVATRARSAEAFALIEEAAWTGLLDALARVELPPSRDRSLPAGHGARTTRGGFVTVRRVEMLAADYPFVDVS